jgi:hypothetical protein
MRLRALIPLWVTALAVPGETLAPRGVHGFQREGEHRELRRPFPPDD